MYRFWTWLSEFVDRQLIRTAPVRTEDDWLAQVQRAAERWERAQNEVGLSDWQHNGLHERKWL